MRFEELQGHDVQGGSSISAVLDDLARHHPEPWADDFRTTIAGGVAFVTFAYDIDGVSMEIAKYARCFENLLPGVPIHCIGGNFGAKVDAVLDPSWRRFEVPGADGWDKWDDGEWFSLLFYEDLEAGSENSRELAGEMWRQALVLAEQLVRYIEDHDIGLLFTVNTNSNPGNVAFGLAIVLAAGTTGRVVINNNHDFYWEGGKAGCKRNPGELPGPRDHFFRNHDNEEFFGFFQRIYPWNGRRWVQANINTLQSRRLIDRFHFRPDRVFTIGTGLDSEYFRACTPEDKRNFRITMGHVLGGDPDIEPTSLEQFRQNIGSWMSDQTPVVFGREGAQALDISTPEALYLLQPTRVVARKRIWRDWELVGALLHHAPFRDVFEQRPDMTLTLHVSGPVPIEHRSCLEHVLDAYQAVLDDVPADIGRRLYLAFSAGCQADPTSAATIDIVDIYQLADLVVFPSLTEGRGLPIAEASAAGTPIVCSHYEPPQVFAEVVGLHLDETQRIQYEEFPPAEFSDELLDRLTTILLDPTSQTGRIDHNRAAVQRRYSLDVLQCSIDELLDRLERTVKGH